MVCHSPSSYVRLLLGSVGSRVVVVIKVGVVKTLDVIEAVSDVSSGREVVVSDIDEEVVVEDDEEELENTASDEEVVEDIEIEVDDVIL